VNSGHEGDALQHVSFPEKVEVRACSDTRYLRCNVGEAGLRFGIIIESEAGRGETRDTERRKPGDLRAERPSWKVRGNHLFAGQAHGA
jgi:hypothetical protein